MAKAKKAAPVAAQIEVLVSTQQIVGSKVGDERETLEAGAELTEAKAKAMGLDADEIERLVARGVLEPVLARVAGGDSADAVQAAQDALAEEVKAHETTKADLEKALADLKAANDELATLKSAS